MNPFQTACGATGPLVLSVEGPGDVEPAQRVFEQPFLLVGREPGCDLRLDHPEVSDRHAYLQLVGGRLVCIDLGSRGGTHQGGRRGRVLDLDRARPIRIGPYRIRLLDGDDPSAGPMASLPADASPVALELRHRSLRQSRAELAPGMTLVGSGDCPVRLIDPSVSTYHVSLVRTPTGVWAVDLLSEGGVRVNGAPKRDVELRPGDVVELGLSKVVWIASGREAPATGKVAAAPAAAPPPTPPTPPPIVAPIAPEPALRASAARPRAPRVGVGVALAVVETAPDGAAVVRAIPAASRAVSPPVERPAPVPAPLPVPMPAPAREAVPDASLPVEQAAEIVERVLTPMVNQVGLIQQQMINDFHRAREEMLASFATLYEEQHGVLRHEVDNLRRIGDELQTLRADLERQSRLLTERLAATAPPPASTPVAAAPPPPPAASPNAQARLGSAASAGPRPPYPPGGSGTGTGTGAHAGAYPNLATPTVTSEAKLPRVRVGGVEPIPTRPPIVATASNDVPTGPAAPGPTLPAIHAAHLDEAIAAAVAHERNDFDAPLVGPASTPSPAPTVPAPGTTPNDDVHARLCDRISRIQDEHQSRWRKVFGIFG